MFAGSWVPPFDHAPFRGPLPSLAVARGLSAHSTSLGSIKASPSAGILGLLCFGIAISSFSCDEGYVPDWIERELADPSEPSIVSSQHSLLSGIVQLHSRIMKNSSSFVVILFCSRHTRVIRHGPQAQQAGSAQAVTHWEGACGTEPVHRATSTHIIASTCSGIRHTQRVLAVTAPP